jgi:hypothetical protein
VSSFPAGAKNRRNLVTLIGAALLAVLVFLFRNKVQFDWPSFASQIRQMSLLHIFAGIALIYGSYCLRAVRWSIYLKPTKRVSASSLIGSQFIGFTAIALFGRFADLTRPYLLGRRAQLSFASQIAVYAIERMFDLGAAAALFSISLALTPHGDPHYKVFFRAGMASLVATAGIAIFAVSVRLAGEPIARAAQRLLGGISQNAGEQAAEKILAFRQGLNAVSSVRDLAASAGLSLVLWAMVGEAYVQTAHAFMHIPELASLSYASTMLLMAVSIGGSVVQLPIIGWFTQIAFIAAAMHALYGAPIEAATACSAMLQIVLWISIIPAGLIWSRVQNVSLKSAEAAAEQAA